MYINIISSSSEFLHALIIHLKTQGSEHVFFSHIRLITIHTKVRFKQHLDNAKEKNAFIATATGAAIW